MRQSSFLVHFMNGPANLSRGTSQGFIPLMWFLLYSLVCISFRVLLIYMFLIFFSFLSACLMVSASNVPMYLWVSFYSNVVFFSWLSSSILSVMCHFQILIINMVHFLCQIPSLYSNCISSLPVEGLPIIFHLWQFDVALYYLVFRFIFACIQSFTSRSRVWEGNSDMHSMYLHLLLPVLCDNFSLASIVLSLGDEHFCKMHFLHLI